MTAFDPSAQIADRAASGSLGVIIRMTQRARELASKGHDIVRLTIGEPDFDTPAHIQAAATDAMAAGHTHYAPIAGIPELREALSRKLKSENQADYSPEEICVSNGAKQAITNTVLALIEPGDEVILLAPFWLAYEQIVRLAGGTPVILHADSAANFKITPDQLSDAMTPSTKLVFINSPSNPTGAVYTRSELEGLADVVRRHPHAMVLSDEIYEYISFDEMPVSMATVDGMRDRTIIVNGLSKGFAMTGWRIGYSAAAAPVTMAITKMQGVHTAGANMFVQRAAVAAIEGSRDCVHQMRDSYRRRRDLIANRLMAMNGIDVKLPPATFYIFPDVSNAFGRRSGNRSIETVEDFCDWLLEDHGVAVVPGTAFGDHRCVRMSFATGDDDIKKAMDRLATAFASLE